MPCCGKIHGSQAATPVRVVRLRIRARHYSLRTEKAHVFWIRRFVRFHGNRHPRELGAPEVESFLTHLAVEARVSSSTPNQALAAILFLHRDVLEASLAWLGSVVRAKPLQHMQVVLSRAEVERVLAHLTGIPWLVVSLLGHADVEKKIFYTHVLNKGGHGVRSPLDAGRGSREQ